MDRENLQLGIIIMWVIVFIFPLIGLVILPLLSIFLIGSISPLPLAIGYLIILPLFLWWYLKRISKNIPSQFEKIEGTKSDKYIEIPILKLKIPIKFIAVLIGLIIALPGILYLGGLYLDYNYFQTNYYPAEAEEKWKDYCIDRYGPDIILECVFQAMFIIWGIAIAIIFYTYYIGRSDAKVDKILSSVSSSSPQAGESSPNKNNILLFVLHLILSTLCGIVASIGVLIIQIYQIIFKWASTFLYWVRLEYVMPPSILELILGIYLIECIIITATYSSTGINKNYTIARTLLLSTIIFSAIFFALIIINQPVISRIAGMA